MGYRYDDLAPGEIYHIFTRGVEQRDIFLDNSDRNRFMELLVHCLPRGKIKSYSLQKRLGGNFNRIEEGKGLVDLICFCLMTNHVHLLIRENVAGGTSLYMKRLLTSYACYFNIRRKRSGSLFIHPFKAVLVDDDDQFLHVGRYIHLNPYAARMVDDPFSYQWSSVGSYVSHKRSRHFRCHDSLIRSMMSLDEYHSFIQDEADYARSLADNKHLLIDYDD